MTTFNVTSLSIEEVLLLCSLCDVRMWNVFLLKVIVTEVGYLTACFLFLIRQQQHTPHMTAKSNRTITPPMQVATNKYRLKQNSFE